MKKIIELTEREVKEMLKQFYSYFSDGYKFEEFLKSYLEKLGLDEVVVTKRSRDGGIDLRAVRKGVGVFGEAGSENYYIQAKRNQPNTVISPEKIRALRGSINAYGKGIFITTAKVSENTKLDAAGYDPQKPIIVIDGNDLVVSCIDNEIGFTYKPVFSKSAMDEIMRVNNTVVQTDNWDFIDIIVEKQVTANDIRARILSIPKVILEKIPLSTERIDVLFNQETQVNLSITRGRNYLAGITEIYKRYGLLSEDGAFNPVKAKWAIDEVENVIKIYFC